MVPDGGLKRLIISSPKIPYTGCTSHLKKDNLKNNASRQVHLVGRGSDLEARQRVELVEEAEEEA